MRVEALGAKSTVERLNERIVRWLSRPGEVERDVVLIGPQIEIAGDELGALIDADRVRIVDLSTDTFEGRHHILAAVAEPRIDRRGEPREQIHDGENAQPRAGRQLIVHKIHRPCLVSA